LGDYAVLPIVFLGLIIVEWAADSWLQRPRFGDPLVAVTAIAAVVLLSSLAPANPRTERHADDLGYLNWVRKNTPCSARLVSNRRTGGLLEALTGRASVTEGMGPHLRPRILDRVVVLLERTRSFFQHPKRNRDFLSKEGIDYLVVFRRQPRIVNLRDFTAKLPTLRVVPFLSRVYENTRIIIYRVEGLASSQALPRPGGYPGYRCDRAPIQAGGIRVSVLS
jgi:hypothetical protein